MFSGGLWFVWLVLLVVGTAGGFALGYLIKNRSIGENISQLQEDARDAVNEARTQAMTLEIEARDKSGHLAGGGKRSLASNQRDQPSGDALAGKAR
jgi:uncharacterized protein HemX